jgi:hypothetical protein
MSPNAVKARAEMSMATYVRMIAAAITGSFCRVFSRGDVESRACRDQRKLRDRHHRAGRVSRNRMPDQGIEVCHRVGGACPIIGLVAVITRCAIPSAKSPMPPILSSVCQSRSPPSTCPLASEAPSGLLRWFPAPACRGERAWHRRAGSPPRRWFHGSQSDTPRLRNDIVDPRCSASIPPPAPRLKTARVSPAKTGNLILNV